MAPSLGHSGSCETSARDGHGVAIPNWCLASRSLFLPGHRSATVSLATLASLSGSFETIGHDSACFGDVDLHLVERFGDGRGIGCSISERDIASAAYIAAISVQPPPMVVGGLWLS